MSRYAVVACVCLLSVGFAVAQAAEPGTIPLEFPAVATKAQAGDWVLCPPREFVDRLQADGPVKTGLVFYSATMVEPGAVESKVINQAKKEMVIPNSLIVPIAKGQTAKPGDIILTWWHSGSGMQRALVVEGGTETQPQVLYLDISYDNPSGWGKKTDRCRADAFHKLDTAFQVGSTLAVKDPKRRDVYNRGLIVNAEGDKFLLLGFAGRLSVANKADCVALPIVPEGLKEGDAVRAPTSFASMGKATVIKVDPAIGRVFIKAIAFGKEMEIAVAFGDVIATLP
jgi:hypothetical protein